MITLEFSGFEEACEALMLDLESQLGQAVDTRLETATDFARVHTPVDTGAMAGAWQWARRGLEGRMEIDSLAVNPRSGTPVSEYAPHVNARLGIVDAAFQRVVTMEITEVGWNGN